MPVVFERAAPGRHEGALVDPDGNVLRFGSSLSSPASSARGAAVAA